MKRSTNGYPQGKLADLVLLSEDPMTCADAALRDARVLLTIVEGRVVFEAPK